MVLPPTRTLDLTHFPLVVAVVPPVLTSAFAEVLEDDHRALFAMKSRYVSISDTTRSTTMPDAKTRQRLAEWAKSHEDDLRRWQIANALVVPSAMIRAGLSAIHWFAPPPVPTSIETDPAKALAFLRQHAERAGLGTAFIDAYMTRQAHASV